MGTNKIPQKETKKLTFEVYIFQLYGQLNLSPIIIGEDCNYYYFFPWNQFHEKFREIEFTEKPYLPNLGCEVLLLDVAAVMGFNGFPSPKVFRITPTIHNYNKTETKQTEF